MTAGEDAEGTPDGGCLGCTLGCFLLLVLLALAIFLLKLGWRLVVWAWEW